MANKQYLKKNLQ